MATAQPEKTEIQRVLSKRGRRTGKVIRWLLLVLLLVGVGFGVKRWREARAKAAETHWLTEPIRIADVHVVVSATGKLQGLNTVEVGAEVTGKVLRVFVDYNEKVVAGQVLAEIDPEQLRAAAEQARAQVSVAKANIRTSEATLAEAKLALTRTTAQVREGLTSQQELESAAAGTQRAEASLAAANANAALAIAALKSAESRLAKTKILAPSGGVVLARYIEPGQTVTAGFTTPVLFKLAEDLSQLSLHVDIDEADIGRVRESNEASFTVDAYPARNFASKVLSLRNEPKTTQSIVSYEAILSVDNAEHSLRPGMTATATITSAVVSGVRVVPNAALRFVPAVLPGDAPRVLAKREEKRVFVLRENKPQPVFIRTGATDGHVTEIASDELAAGEQVITDAIVAN